MKDQKACVLLEHGSGGRASQRFIEEIFLSGFAQAGAAVQSPLNDAALVDITGPVAMSTDSFVVDPVFFPGGDIGTLAVCGTVNDVAMLGARPLYMSCAFILEEGLPLADLRTIVCSMAETASRAGVRVVTGDTKVLPAGMADKIFINTTGVGCVLTAQPPCGTRAGQGDAVVVSGPVGEHGLTILAQREGLVFETPLQSDCAALNHIIQELVTSMDSIHVLRDPTRGGLGTALGEIAMQSHVGIMLYEKDIPVHPAVKNACSFLGLDPLFLACEGRFICILPEQDVHKALTIMHAHQQSQQAVCIGRVSHDNPGTVRIQTPLGGQRLLTIPEAEQLPRIC